MSAEEHDGVSGVCDGGGTPTKCSRDFQVTGSSCRALKSAVSKLNRLDDFFCESIGTGFFSEVFKVTHKVTGQVMVLKMNLLHSNRPNMLKEVQLMNQLSHPNILGFMGVCVHEGQLHALTEFINGGRLEKIIQDRSIELSYCVRMKLALDIAKGMEYLHSKEVFHRDLTSKNVLVKTNNETGEMIAVVGDFGFAARIPRHDDRYRLPTVGSAYWMSPECLKGEWYDEKSDVFSYGVILCEMIARVEADPDVLTRTENFGLDYIAFTSLCDTRCPPPPAFLKLAFTCCNYEPRNRPSFKEIVNTIEKLIAIEEAAQEIESCADHSRLSVDYGSPHAKLCHRRSHSDDGIRMLGETMARQDVYYKPAQLNPFTNITALKGRKKIVNHSSSDTTCTDSECGGVCLEGEVAGGTVIAEPVVKPSEVLQTLREHSQPLDSIFAAASSRSSLGALKKGSNEDTEERRTLYRTSLPPSLPSSPTFSRRMNSTPKPNPRTLFKPLRTCSSGSNLVSLDDHTVFRRRGSCESGFFSSVGEDFCTPGLELVASSSVTLSSSSAASSLSHTCCESLTDGLMAGVGVVGGANGGGRLLRRHHPKRTSSVYTDSSDDISALDSDHQGPQQIHKMVEYFERKQTTEPKEFYRHLRSTCESRGAAALRRVSHRLLLCEGAVSSKLQIFDKK